VPNKEDKEKTDTITNIYANPWMRNPMIQMLNFLDSNAVEFVRPIAVEWCAYSVVIQLRDNMPDEIGGIAWFSFDNPAQSPRIPIFSGALKLHESFYISGQHKFREDAAHWQFRMTNRLSVARWEVMGKKYINPAIKELEDKAFSELPNVEKQALALLEKDNTNAKEGTETQLAREYLTNYSIDFARLSIQRWQDIRDYLWTEYRFGF
jgi:dipeptidase